uniref:Mitochondrial inner membrane protease ATP23 n=1 Tax=Sinocyclocheilus anshuiensis TaxID=1608454 RepID=A0A671SAH0_9TELE
MARNRAEEEESSNKEPLQDSNRPDEQKEFGYSSKHKQGSIGESLFTFRHKCQIMLQFAMDTSPYAKLLLGAMKSSVQFIKTRHFSCEDCDGTVSGGFDAATSQIVLCQNNIHQQAHMNRVVTHELIHAFDHCRARVDWFSSFRHLACSESHAGIGVCFVSQVCVRSRALRSILVVRKVSREEAEQVVDEVFDSCFHDHAPFSRIPHSRKDAKFAYRDYENRDRYYANL